MHNLASEEHATLSEQLSNLVQSTFPSLLLPAQSSTAHLSALVELKAGVGGAESSLFLLDMQRMYTRFATFLSLHQTIVSSTPNSCVIEIKGKGAYDMFQWESGVHRVQRVPATEASGRLHTSTVAAIVLPLADEKESSPSEDLYKLEDVKVEVMRARGAGGQHVNKTESAVRLTHIPTGINVSMQDERSQHQNKRRAFTILTARLLDQKLTADVAKRRATRNSLVRSVDRSEKIRTYNYPQERVTDHRLPLTLRNLSAVLDGEGLQVFIDALAKDRDAALMESVLDDESQ